MAKGHRSQIKRDRNSETKGHKTICKAFLCKNFSAEGMFRFRCHKR